MKPKRICNDLVVKLHLMSLLLGIFVLIPQRTVIASVAVNDNMYYDYGTYDIQYIIDGIWHDGYNVRVVVTNKTEQTISDWEMVFKSSDTIINIWNANIAYNGEGLYIINNDNWNKEIPANGSIEWGYTAHYNDVPTYAFDFEVREKITGDISDENFEDIMNVLLDSDLENGESVTVNNAYVIECVEEDFEEIPKLRAGAYASTKTKSVTFYIYVKSSYEKAFTMKQTAEIVVNSIKNTVRIKSHSFTVTGATLVKKEFNSILNVEQTFAAGSNVSVQVKYKNKSYYFLGMVTAYPTGSCQFDITQL